VWDYPSKPLTKLLVKPNTELPTKPPIKPTAKLPMKSTVKLLYKTASKTALKTALKTYIRTAYKTACKPTQSGQSKSRVMAIEGNVTVIRLTVGWVFTETPFPRTGSSPNTLYRRPFTEPVFGESP
jgi:hypothetical protein